MCKCDPSIRTPYCGKPGCEWPKQEGVKVNVYHFTGRLRLGFTGAGGTGKGALAQRIAHRLGITYLPSTPAEIGAAFGMEHYKDHKTHDHAVAFQYAALHAQIYQEKALHIAGKGYIAERTSLDYIPYWLQKVGMAASATLNEVYINTAFEWALKGYTMIVYCPHEFAPTDGQAWKERDPQDQRFTDSVIRNWLDNVQGRVPVVRVSGSIEERFDQVIAALTNYLMQNCPAACMSYFERLGYSKEVADKLESICQKYSISQDTIAAAVSQFAPRPADLNLKLLSERIARKLTFCVKL